MNWKISLWFLFSLSLSVAQINIGNISDLINNNLVPNELIDLISNDQFLETIKLWQLIDVWIRELRLQANDNDCYRDLNVLLSEDGMKEEWVLRMLDANAKPQPGILYGNVANLGNFDECVSIRSNDIYGKYCTVPILPKEQENKTIELMDVAISWGFCFPSSCNSTYIQPLIDEIEKNVSSVLHFKIIDKFCVTEAVPRELTQGNIIAISLFAFFGFLLLLSTLYDLLNKNPEKSTAEEALLAFSLYSNGKKLFSSTTTDGSLTCLNGLRVVSMFWILAGHQYTFAMMVPKINAAVIPDYIDEWHAVIILSTSMAVDTFFTISGLLLMYISLRNNEAYKKQPLIMFYLHRYLRLTPSLIMVIIFSAFMIDLMGTGPFWFAVRENLSSYCLENWWPTILYIQNYYETQKICVPQSWYLAVDTQLYYIAPLIFYFLFKWRKSTLGVLGLTCLGSCVFSFVYTWENKYVAAFFDQASEQFERMYVPTHTRCTSWIVGTLVGYILFSIRDKKINLSKGIIFILWISSLATLLGIILFHKTVAKSVLNQYSVTLESRIYSSVYNACVRPIWSIALGIIIFLCIHGYGGIINKILSWYIFNIMIRVNYSMYLLHILVISYFYAQRRTADFGAHTFMLQDLWSNVMFTFLASIIWTLAFESPIIKLEKMLFNKNSPNKPSSNTKNKLSDYKSEQNV